MVAQAIDMPVGADALHGGMSASPSASTPLSSKGILLFGHGARNPEWAAPFTAIRAEILARSPDALVESGFLELMRPTFAEAVDRLVAQGAGEITVVPIFMAAGSHINKDLPLLAAAAMDQHQGVEIKLASASGPDDQSRTAGRCGTVCAWCDGRLRNGGGSDLVSVRRARRIG